MLIDKGAALRAVRSACEPEEGELRVTAMDRVEFGKKVANAIAALDTAPAPDPAQIRREALEEAKQIALRIQAEEEAHSGDIALERAGAAEEIAYEIEALITGGQR